MPRFGVALQSPGGQRAAVNPAIGKRQGHRLAEPLGPLQRHVRHVPAASAAARGGWQHFRSVVGVCDKVASSCSPAPAWPAPRRPSSRQPAAPPRAERGGRAQAHGDPRARARQGLVRALLVHVLCVDHHPVVRAPRHRAAARGARSALPCSHTAMGLRGAGPRDAHEYSSRVYLFCTRPRPARPPQRLARAHLARVRVWKTKLRAPPGKPACRGGGKGRDVSS